MNKKAQGISLNVIIIAVIALIVLVILAVIFTGRLGVWGRGVSNISGEYTGVKCAVPGANRRCMTEDDCIEDFNGVVVGDMDCKEKGATYICCAY